MKRSVPLRRTGRLRPARYRAVGRPSLPRAQYRKLVDWIKARCGRCCEAPWCRRKSGILDPAHVQARSAGGADSVDNVVMLCRFPCHDAHDRLRAFTIDPQGDEHFIFTRPGEPPYHYYRPKGEG